MALTALALLGLSACDGCRGRSAENPARYLSKDAEGVLELRDIGLFMRAREKLPVRVGNVVTPEQLAQLQTELSLTLGFDPTTAEGLAAAGLPKSGAVAMEVFGGGEATLWVVPTTSPEKLKPLLEKLVRSRVPVDEIVEDKAGGQPVTVLKSAFGEEKTVSAAYAFHQGMAFVGFGSTSVELIGAAVTRKPGDSVLEHPEYQAQVKALGDAWEVRLVSPTGGKALGSALDNAASVTGAPKVDPKKLALLTSTGWILDFTSHGAEVRGRLRLGGEGLEQAKKVFAASADGVAGIGHVDVPGTLVFARVAADPHGLLDLFAPVGSGQRARLSQGFERMKKDAGIDMEAELLPLLSGQAAVALGMGELGPASLRALTTNPLSLVWTAFGFGVKDSEQALALERRLDPGLTAQGMTVGSRKVGSTDVRVVAPANAPEGTVLVETFGLPKAWLFSNEPAITERIVAAAPGADPLGGKSGLYAELRFTELSSQLAKINMAAFPLIWRSIANKVVEAVRSMDKASFHLEAVEDGLAVKAVVKLAPPQAGATP